jgi:hypothetical protein
MLYIKSFPEMQKISCQKMARFYDKVTIGSTGAVSPAIIYLAIFLLQKKLKNTKI